MDTAADVNSDVEDVEEVVRLPINGVNQFICASVMVFLLCYKVFGDLTAPSWLSLLQV